MKFGNYNTYSTYGRMDVKPVAFPLQIQIIQNILYIISTFRKE